jgi:hypothetical protein
MSKKRTKPVQEIRAEDLVRELTQDADTSLLYLQEARVTGDFSLKHLTIDKPIVFKDCRFTGEVDLRYSEFNQVVDFSGCIFFKDLNSGDDIESRTIYKKDLICNRAWFEGVAKFNGIQVEGSASFSAASFLNKGLSPDFTAAHVQNAFVAQGATFAGPASFNTLKCGGPGFFRGATFEQDVDFGFASFDPVLDCSKMELDEAASDEKYRKTTFGGAANFSSLKCAGDGFFSEATFKKDADFSLATFGSTLQCWKVIFGGSANFGSLKCTNLYCDSATFEGGVSFNTLECGDSGFFTNAQFQNKEEQIDFSYASFGGNLYCNPATFKGGASFNTLECGDSGFFTNAQFQNKEKQVDFSYASFARALSCEQATFAGLASFVLLKCSTLNCNGATFEGGASFNSLECESTGNFGGAHFEGEGEVNIAFTRFGRNLDLSNAQFGGSVDMSATSISQGLLLTGAQFEHEVTLYKASITVLVLDDPEGLGDNAFIFKKEEGSNGKQQSSWKGSLDLGGCTFSTFRGPKEQAINFAEAQDPGKWNRDPYKQLEAYYSSVGDEGEARKMYYRGRCAAREKAKDSNSSVKWPLITTWWSDLSLKWLTGYGVQTWRLLVPIVVVLVFGLLVFLPSHALNAVAVESTAASAKSGDKSETSKATSQEKGSRKMAPYIFDRAAYNVDIFLPALDLGAADKWEPQGLWRKIYILFHSIIGWLLIPLLIASLAGIIRKQ